LNQQIRLAVIHPSMFQYVYKQYELHLSQTVTKQAFQGDDTWELCTVSS